MARLIDNQLVQAALYGNIIGVRDALGGGANVNAKDEDGDTALVIAAGGGYVDIVRELLERGADVNINDTENGKNSLHYAICNVNEKISNKRTAYNSMACPD
jgi:ankyrin repeat protein